MADKNAKVPENVDGPYYVDDTCTACGNCVDEAPDNFKLGEDYAYVFKQPENDEEREQCESALENCPAESIGNDG